MTQFKKARELPVVSEAPWDDDVFKTLEGYATFLSNALIADPGPFVLNVNGAWGSGKTFFVRRWAADLRNQGYPVVEFNAWENDAADDPLAPLMACFIEAQSEILPKEKAEKFKQVCGKYILTGGGLIVRAGLKQFLGEKGIDQINDLLDSDAENQLIELAGKHIDEQLAKQKAAKGLHDLLTAFVESVREKQDTQLPVFFFIDELDRCRPTFAIELLERVKHLFNVDGIKFIVSTDSEQLVHSINGVYGNQFDGVTYLRRFFDETFTLPEPTGEQYSELLWEEYSKQEKAGECWLFLESPASSFEMLARAFHLSLRDQSQVHHRMMAVMNNIKYSSEIKLHFAYLAVLVILRMKDVGFYRQLIGEPSVGQGFPSSEFKKWDEIGNSLVINGLLNELINKYFELSKISHEEAIKRFQSAQAKIEDPQARSNHMSWLEYEIYNSAIRDFKSFKAYPQLVELTASVETL